MDLIPQFFNTFDESQSKNDILINNYNHTEVGDPNKTTVAIIFNKKTGMKTEPSLKENFLLEAEYMGIYLKESNIWVWSWSTNISKSLIPLSSNLINYALSFEEDKINREDFSLIRTMLVNSRIKIQNNDNLELLLGMILYITKGVFIIPIEKKFKNQTVINYFMITDTIKKKIE